MLSEKKQGTMSPVFTTTKLSAKGRGLEMCNCNQTFVRGAGFGEIFLFCFLRFLLLLRFYDNRKKLDIDQ